MGAVLSTASLPDAISKNDIKAVKRILRGHHDINSLQEKQTPLCLAVSCGFVEMVELLLNHGANPNAVSYVEINQRERRKDFPWTSLHEACRVGSAEMLQMLLVASGNPDLAGHDGMTPLHVAAWHGHTDIIRILIQAGCDVNKKDSFQESALVLPITRGDTATVQMLLLASCKLNSRAWYSRTIRTSQDVYMAGYREPHDLTGCDGPNTLFSHAIQSGWIHIAILFLQHGFNANHHAIKDVLRIAAYNGIGEEEVGRLVRAIFASGYRIGERDLAGLRSFRHPDHRRILEKYESIVEWVRSQEVVLPTLGEQCRLVIRSQLRHCQRGQSIWTAIDTLQLPTPLLRWLKLLEVSGCGHQPPVENFPVYFQMHKRKIVPQKHVYLIFWRNTCCCFKI